MNEKLFWVAAVRYPTKKQEEDGTGGTIVLSAQLVLAADEDQARLIAAKQLPDDLKGVRVFVSPF